MFLDKNKYVLNNTINIEEDRENWGNARTVLALLEIAENYKEIIQNSVIKGIMYSKLFTEWEREDNSDKIAVSFSEDTILSDKLYDFLFDKLTMLPEYNSKNTDNLKKEYDGVIIYE